MPRLLLALAFLIVVAGASFACTRDPYIDDVADIQDDLIEKIDELLTDFDRNSEQCSLSLFSTTACERGIENLEDMRVEAQFALLSAAVIDPPAYAATWHRDYLIYLDDSAAVFDDAARALTFGDEDDLDRVFTDIEALGRREDDLIERFAELQ